jgi:hypothetical protein
MICPTLSSRHLSARQSLRVYNHRHDPGKHPFRAAKRLRAAVRCLTCAGRNLSRGLTCITQTCYTISLMSQPRCGSTPRTRHRNESRNIVPTPSECRVLDERTRCFLGSEYTLRPTYAQRRRTAPNHWAPVAEQSAQLPTRGGDGKYVMRYRDLAFVHRSTTKFRVDGWPSCPSQAMFQARCSEMSPR